MHWLFCVIFILACVVPAHGQERPSFDQWLADLRLEALDKGIAPAVVDQALADVTPVEAIVRSDRNQAEFVETYETYLSKRVSDWRVQKGRERLAELKPLIADIGAAYKVQPRFIAAIWGMETNYGTVKPGYRLFDALATLAYDPRRATFYRQQLFHGLTILDQGLARFEDMTSSYGGAMGQPQFLPAAYLDYAVDYDQDGRRDIWDSDADVLASIANYLSRFGWRDDQTWGRAVQIPAGIVEAGAALPAQEPAGRCGRYKSLGPTLMLADWQSLGVRKTDGADLPSRNLRAALIVSDGNSEAGWLVYRNFCTLMAYNAAFKYALGVGILSDRIWY